jgi:sialic acid synthase SpsE
MIARKRLRKGFPAMRTPAFQLVDRRPVGGGAPTLVIAEIGQNHNGRIDLAEQLVDAASWAGADAIKTVKRDLSRELTTAARNRRYDSPHAFGGTYGEHREALELSVETHAALAERARRHGMSFIATVCDVPSAEQLRDVGVDAFKIASRDLNNLPLVTTVARYGRPVILSTGMSSLSEIDAAVAAMRRADCPYAVLQCTSLYPTPDADVHLRSMAGLTERYKAPIGFSDHTLGTVIATAAVALGAAIIEKHFTLDRSLKGTDHSSSAEPEEFATLVENIRRVERALGRADKPLVEGVDVVRQKLGRSLVTRERLPAGTVIDESMLTLKSPGDGIAWSERGTVVGRRLKRDLPADEVLHQNDVE